jgi:cell division protein FtsB
MTDPEREHFARQLHDLERRLRRWQLVAFVLAALLLVPVVGVGLLGVIVLPRMQVERLRAAERARAAEMRARSEAVKALQEAEKARPAAEKKRAGEDKVREKD